MSQSTSAGIREKLEELAQLRAAAAAAEQDYEAKRAEILKAVQAELDALAAEYEPLLATVNERAAELEGAVREDVLRLGASVRGKGLYATYSRGRITWDTKGLDQYAARHADVLKFRREGKPYVTLNAPKRPGDE